MPLILIPDHQGNTDVDLDGRIIRKGDPEPVDLTDDEVARIERSGITVQIVDGDPIDALKGETLDNAVREAGVEGAGNLSADEKRAALRERRRNSTQEV